VQAVKPDFEECGLALQGFGGVGAEPGSNELQQANQAAAGEASGQRSR
jgi:hypothetical protein